jgi:hypothetical protein
MRLFIAVLFVGMVTGLLSGPVGVAGQKPAPGDEKGGKKDPPKGDDKKSPDELETITIKAMLTKTDPFDSKRPQCHHKVHVVKMLAGFTYVIDMKAELKKDKDDPSFDTYLRLEDPNGKELAENDDYITTDSRITFSADKDGEYRIICTTFDDGFTGSYTLTVAGYKGGVKKGGDPVLILNLNGVLTAKEPFDDKRANSHCKVHLFKMQPGKTYQIDMISNQFDAYLRLEDSKGTQLDEDDDSGGMLNARIIFTPTKADEYRIIATTFGPNMTGMYQLKISKK